MITLIYLIILIIFIILIVFVCCFFKHYKIYELGKRAIKLEFPLIKSTNLLGSLKDIPRKIIIDKADLGLCIEYFRSVYNDKSGWKASLPFLIAMLVVYFTTNVDQQKIKALNKVLGFNLTVSDVSNVFVLVLILSLIWFIKDIFKYIKNGNPYVRLFDKIKENSVNKPDYTAVFLFKKTIGNKKYILVEYKSSWKCFFLPYYKENNYYEKNDRKFIDKLSRKIIGLNNDVKILDVGVSKHAERYDPPENVVKDYNFTIYSIYKCSELNYSDCSVINNGTIPDGFFWMELDELLKHETTVSNNREVIILLLENRTSFFDNNLDYNEDE